MCCDGTTAYLRTAQGRESRESHQLTGFYGSEVEVGLGGVQVHDTRPLLHSCGLHFCPRLGTAREHSFYFGLLWLGAAKFHSSEALAGNARPFWTTKNFQRLPFSVFPVPQRPSAPLLFDLCFGGPCATGLQGLLACSKIG